MPQLLIYLQTRLSIQAGIDAATAGDTVLVAAGTNNENINFNGKSIIVASEYLIDNDNTHINQTIIDGNQNGSVVTFNSEEDSTAILSGFTITNGRADNYGNYENGGVFISKSLIQR